MEKKLTAWMWYSWADIVSRHLVREAVPSGHVLLIRYRSYNTAADTLQEVLEAVNTMPICERSEFQRITGIMLLSANSEGTPQ